MKPKDILAVMKKYKNEILMSGLATVTLVAGGATLAKLWNQVEPLLPNQSSGLGTVGSVVVVTPEGKTKMVPMKKGRKEDPKNGSCACINGPYNSEYIYFSPGPRPTPPWKGEAADDGKEPKTPTQGTPESEADTFKQIQDFVQKQIEERQRREDIDQTGLFPNVGQPRATINPDTGKPIEKLCEIDGSCNTPMEGSAVVNHAVDEAITDYMIEQILGRKLEPKQSKIDSPVKDTILMEPTSENFCGKDVCPVTIKVPKSESSAKYVRVGSRKEGRPVYKRVPKAAADNLCKSVVAKKLDVASSLYLADFEPRVSEVMAFADQQMQGVAGLVAPAGRKVRLGRRVDVKLGQH